MRLVLTITDLTRMTNDHVCIAGYDPVGRCIRPTRLGNIPETWLTDDGGRIVTPFAQVLLGVKTFPKKDPPHTEDFQLMDDKWKVVGALDAVAREKLLKRQSQPAVADIFGHPIMHEEMRWYLPHGKGGCSLGTVGPVTLNALDLFWREDTPHAHVTFTDPAGAQYRLNPTDLTFRYWLSTARKHGYSPDEVCDIFMRRMEGQTVYLRIGLTRANWDKHPDCCHLQINGIYGFPTDYAKGKTYAELRSD